MKHRRWRDLAFTFHRWIGVVIATLLIFIGLTGSLLVFQAEIDGWLTERQFGTVTVASSEYLPAATILDIAKSTYPDWQPENLYLPKDNHHPYKLRMTSAKADDRVYLDGAHEVFIQPYTGIVMGDRLERFSFYRLLLNLHYRLFAEEIGIIIVGVASFLLLILCLTGLVLWTGWSKLINGFKIKWNAHPQRVNFDIHKVTGIIAVSFLTLTAATGFCWNFHDFSHSAIYALTGSPIAPDPVSKPSIDRPDRGLTEIIRNANLAFPDGVTTSVSIPTAPSEVFSVYKRIDRGLDYGNTIYLDRFSGQVIRIDDERKAALGDRIFSSFYPLHSGTFGGLLTRILYVFVGLAPTILAITGFTMFRLRRGGKATKKEARDYYSK